MVLEVSGNYSIIVPAIISNMIAYFISHRYQKVPLFDFLARQDSLFLPSIEELREQTALRVEDAMRPGGGNVWRKEDPAEVSGADAVSAVTPFLLWHRDDGWRIASGDDLRRRAEALRTGSAPPEIPAATTAPAYADQRSTKHSALSGIGLSCLWSIAPISINWKVSSLSTISCGLS